jgi:hypothetical protein
MAGFVAWYNNAAARAVIGKTTNLASILLCIEVPAMNPRGHSQASIIIPKTRLMIWRIGKGFTAASRVLVRKSQNILGQKNPSSAAAIWSTLQLVTGGQRGEMEYEQTAAVITMRRAQWFLMSFPMIYILYFLSSLCLFPMIIPSKSLLLPLNVPDGLREMKLRLKVVLVKKWKLKSCKQEGQVRVSGPADWKNEG